MVTARVRPRSQARYISGCSAGDDRRSALRLALSFTWSCSTWPDPGLRSLVTVLLEPRERQQTLMTIEHALLPPGLVDQHARGWEAIARQLAHELAPATPAPTPHP